MFNPKNNQQATLLGNILPTVNGLLGFAPLPGTSPSNIDKFRTNLSAHNELAKVDKFDVLIQLPSALRNLGGGSDDLALQCEAAELPGREISMIEYRHYGFTRRIPHMNMFGQATFTFYVMGDMWEKKMFDSWMDLMIPSHTDSLYAGLVTYPEDAIGFPVYETNILVNQYNMTGQMVYQTLLNDCVPTSIAPLATSWQTDDLHRLSVTFAFRNWVTMDTSQTGNYGKKTGVGAIVAGFEGQVSGAINNFSNQLTSLIPFGPKIGPPAFNFGTSIFN